MPARRRVLLAVLFAIVAAGCGASTTAPQETGCQIVGGKVQVVIVYARDRTKVSPAQAAVAFPPSLALIDHGDITFSTNSNPQLTRIDDYTWTVTIFVIPNTDPMSHGATVIDLALLDPTATLPNPYAVTGVTANGVQLRKILVAGLELGYFGVDACGRISV